MLSSLFPMLQLHHKSLLPIVQGGMGIGVSAHRLAGAVARENAVGTIASVDLRHHHPDLLQEAGKSRDKVLLDRLNLIALDREIRAAQATAAGQGLIAVNVMKAVHEHPAYVRQACESGADLVVMGAGLPMDLPDMTAQFPQVGLVPILSDARGVSLVLRKWLRKRKLPAAIVIEHPRYAGGHLGAPRPEDLGDRRFDWDVVLPAVRQVLRDLGLEAEHIPLVAAGGLADHDKIREVTAWGADAVQIGTAFAVTQEGDAHPAFKQVLAQAQPEDIVEFMSVAGLPARGVLTPWLKRYLQRESRLQRMAKADPERCAPGLQCLTICGLRDGIAKVGQFCIDTKLASALRGDVERGLFFRGATPLPFGEHIRSVRELLDYLLNGKQALPA